ncbi:hypothetical protein PACTADRAFT_34109 [Pachysolen tannophilus NRRL Y-2460]|uniref:hydroxymethylglutaryl-CoA reductase (NADPH) n=1 Tax=Pachysolen tannophilus NRRL Y-2460 TaxID=669874 RepID=A0A1E4TUT3_PACTA|nr:hypothetical protein PACTADRAFT_34109 [Pachysolen tannophilus NRRL Y-2460]
MSFLKSIVTKPAAMLSKTSASYPIHTLITLTLLASYAYLSIVDEYIVRGSNLNNNNGGSGYVNPQVVGEVSFYHPHGSNDYNNWIEIEDYSQFSNDVDHIAVTYLTFKDVKNHELPEIKDSFQSMVKNERILITDFDGKDKVLANLNKLTSSDGTNWKLRHPNGLESYSDYAKLIFQRLENCIRGAETSDITLIVIAYIAMWYTFCQLFFGMREVGSKFWLAFGSLLSSGFGFLFALYFVTIILELPISLTTLSEGLPFLVATIGFKHKVVYTEPILKFISKNKRKDIPNIIARAVEEVAALHLIKYHSIVLGAFLGCSIYAQHLEGLRNFCILSAAILVSDLLMTFSFYSAVLALKAEINKVHESLELKEFLQEDGISENVAGVVAEKNSKSTIFQKNAGVVGFKIAIIAVFFGIHLFVLGTSWMYDSNSEYRVSFADTKQFVNVLSKTTAQHIKIGQNGTIATIMPPRVFTPTGFIAKAEDVFLSSLHTIAKATIDPLISKFLLLVTAISVSINAYLLNATRSHIKNVSVVAEAVSVAENIKKTEHNNKSTETIVSSFSKPANRNFVSSSVEHVETDDTISSSDDDIKSVDLIPNQEPKRSVEELVEYMKEGKLKTLSDSEVATLVTVGKVPLYALEKQLADNTRAVAVRRKAIANLADAPILETNKLPYKHYDYNRVFGACCENVIGYMPLPVGVAGPLIIDGNPFHIPMATTEGCLVASTMRGCKAINAGGGVTTVLTADGMTRGPCVSFPSLIRAGAAKMWLDSEEGSTRIKKAFNSTSRFARLQSIQCCLAGTLLFIRFRTTTGDAMGMNMISKGVEYSLKYMIEECGFEDMVVISVSGNYCSDKKAAAINWIEGRGKSVVAEARVPADVVRKVLKSDVKRK